jgi:hypothetical protein
MKIIQSESYVFATVDPEHKKMYPDQYSHPMCNKKVRVKKIGEPDASGNAAQENITGMVERVFVTRFGQMAKIRTSSGDSVLFLVRDLVQI